MKNFRLKYIYFTALTLFSLGCTDLEVEEVDSLLLEDESGEFAGVNAEATLESAYFDLRQFGTENNLNALLEVTSDELLVPTRGTDWGDNGQWRTLHQHTWDATHPFVLSTWNILNANVYKLNQILNPATTASETQTAEAKFLRAYNMYLILDLYGKIPFREATEGVDVDPRVFAAPEAFDFILKDLTDALPNLPELGPGIATIGASKASANFLLAKLYLNKHIFLGNPEADDADMTKVIESVDAINADGFQLQEGYFDIFAPGADQETILWTDAEIGNRIWNGLHYHQQTSDNPGGGWNGFSTTAEFYNLFEGDPNDNTLGSGQEERRGFVPTDTTDIGTNIGYGFLVGQQYAPDGSPLLNRSGQPLIFTKTFPGLAGNGEGNGIRIIKYHPINGAYTRGLILFRYADAHLMKAEALARQDKMGEALQLINELRILRDATPLENLQLSDILDERGRELYIEGWRRNDQIRFGTYTDPWTFKGNTEEFRKLFPIPATAIATNPNLEQNPGY